MDTSNITGIKIGGADVEKLYLGGTKIRPIVSVTGITLDKNSVILTSVGQTSQLTATIAPADADNQNVSWTSSDTSVATVSSSGLVTCVTPGTATITATTEDGGFTATCGISSEVTDVITTNAYTNSHHNTSYFYGVKFTALKSGKITKIGFCTEDSFSGRIKIAQGNYASATGTTYDISGVYGEYTLGTPFSITAGNNYVVCFRNDGYTYYPSSVSYPKVGDAVQFDYGTISGSSSQSTTVWNIVSITVEIG